MISYSYMGAIKAETGWKFIALPGYDRQQLMSEKNMTSTAIFGSLKDLSPFERDALLVELLKDFISRRGVSSAITITTEDKSPLGYYLPATATRKPPFFSLAEWDELHQRIMTPEKAIPGEEFLASLNLEESLETEKG